MLTLCAFGAGYISDCKPLHGGFARFASMVLRSHAFLISQRRPPLPRPAQRTVRRCFSIASGKKELEINNQIRDKEVRLINADGSQMGVVPTRDALRLAEEQDLDLVKIAPQATPPVCKVLDYGKYRFELQKKEKEVRRNQKVVEIKEVRLSLKIDTNDLNTKLAQATRFLKNGDKVKVSIRFRGREMAHANLGLGVMQRFAEALAADSTVEKEPKLEGRSMLMFLASTVAKENARQAAKAAATATATATEEKTPE